MNALTCVGSLSAAFLLLGCSDGETPTPAPIEIAHCNTPFLGDPALDPEIEPLSLTPTYMLAPITEGGSVSLLVAPESGPVLFVGARVRNMNLCAIRLASQLRDPVSDRVLFDSRLVNFEPTNDGWGESLATDISTVSNISVCPNRWSMQDLFGQHYELTVTVTDREGRTVTKSLRVVPACDEPGHEAWCTCLCKQGYVLGEQCSNSSDAGP